MSPIEIEDLAFAWPAQEAVTPGDAELGPAGAGDSPTSEPTLVFNDLNVAFPPGFGFLVGPNGIGKSTMLLLAGARIFPQAGRVSILGTDSTRFVDAGMDPALEEERNRLVSFVYQNMEFQTEAPIDTVFDTVQEASVSPDRSKSVREDLIRAAGLGDRLGSRMQELSKGEMQRAIVAMSVLYGSPIIMMDEPVFAVEPRRAIELFTYLKAYCREYETHIYASVHDVELARKFADTIILFDTDRNVIAGEPRELLARDRLEGAFRAPYDTLYQRQNLYRDLLAQSYRADEGEGAAEEGPVGGHGGEETPERGQ